MVMVNNSTNTNKLNNHISPSSPNIKKKKLEMRSVARDSINYSNTFFVFQVEAEIQLRHASSVILILFLLMSLMMTVW
jgi:hypothetical protein